MAAKPEAPAPEAAAPAPAAPPAKSSLVPLIAVLALSPILTFAIAQFVLLPQLKKSVAPAPAAEAGEADPHAEPAGDEPAAEAEAPAHGKGKEEKGGHGGKGGEAASGNTYIFENVVVNLAGTMGTRYLKTTFMVTGKDPKLASRFEAMKPQMVDVTLNVLSSLTLADLEEAGAKNLIREKLIAAYNGVLGKKIAEQVYFSDFVVQ